jgi:hypothetical protein
MKQSIKAILSVSVVLSLLFIQGACGSPNQPDFGNGSASSSSSSQTSVASAMSASFSGSSSTSSSGLGRPTSDSSTSMSLSSSLSSSVPLLTSSSTYSSSSSSSSSSRPPLVVQRAISYQSSVSSSSASVCLVSPPQLVTLPDDTIVRISDFLACNDVFSLLNTTQFFQPFLTSNDVWGPLMAEWGIDPSSKNVRHCLATCQLMDHRLRLKLAANTTRIGLYQGVQASMKNYIGKSVVDNLLNPNWAGPLFDETILKAARDPEDPNCKTARRLMVMADLADSTMQGVCGKGELFSWLFEMNSSFPLLKRAIVVYPRLTAHETLNLAYRLGTLSRVSSTSAIDEINFEHASIYECTVALRGFLKGISGGVTRREHQQKIRSAVLTLLGHMKNKKEYNPTLEHCELIVDIYEQTRLRTKNEPRPDEKIIGLARRMIELAQESGAVTPVQFNLASTFFCYINEFGEAAKFAFNMVKAAKEQHGVITKAQYMWALTCYESLLEKLSSPGFLPEEPIHVFIEAFEEIDKLITNIPNFEDAAYTSRKEKLATRYRMR